MQGLLIYGMWLKKFIEYFMLVALVAALPKLIWTIDANCDYYQNVLAGVTYYVVNSQYPNFNYAARSCRWYAQSATNLRLSCQVTLPATANCAGDRLSVSPSGNLQLTDAQNYCGTGSFEVTSTGNYLNIVFTALRGTTGGRFLCTLRATTVTTPTCSCGWKNPRRIVGGAAPGVNEYPMMAGLVDTQRRLLYCGGTIIAPKYVLTAAHCRPTNIPITELVVLVGDHDITTGTDTSSASIHIVATWVSHPSYQNDTQANDIAVVTVVGTIVFTMAVGPACLPFRAASNSFFGLKVDVLGWGLLEFSGAKSDVLQKVELDVITTSQCQQTFPSVTDNQLCTYTPGKDSCQFDSGGPVLWLNPNTRRLVSAALISAGRDCAGSSPGINTRIGPYMNWILSVTPGANYCRLE